MLILTAFWLNQIFSPAVLGQVTSLLCASVFPFGKWSSNGQSEAVTFICFESFPKGLGKYFKILIQSPLNSVRAEVLVPKCIKTHGLVGIAEEACLPYAYAGEPKYINILKIWEPVFL